MTNLDELKSRYMKDPFSIRLGNLASNLARISSFIDNPRNNKVVESILEESKFFVEWLAPQASMDLLARLAEIQESLALWQRQFPRYSKKKSIIKEKTTLWSKYLIKASGLTD